MTMNNASGVRVLIILGLIFLGGLAEAQELVFITHKRITATLKPEEIQQIFLGKKTRWDDGTKIVFVVFTEKPAYTVFLKKYVKKSSSQFINYWKKQVFTGKGRMPKSFTDPLELLDFIAETQGAISFAQQGEVDRDRVNVSAIID